MGIERNAAALLLKMRSGGVKFGRVLTLGRQNIHLELDEYQRALRQLGRAPAAALPTYADELLLAMGAESVDSMDASGYEEATLTHDLNRATPADWNERFDLVFDGGTLEHVFDFPTAIKNCMRMVRPGGRFVSVTIPNNWCGHGFYQFSPELFFRVFSADNGFSIQEMYVAELDGAAYAVKDPATVGGRVELCNTRPVYLLVHARREAVREIFARTPQQSDYVEWDPRQQQTPKQVPPWKSYPGIRQLRNCAAGSRGPRHPAPLAREPKGLHAGGPVV
ncbi:MAG: methyltransferase domain-containing protein [Rubrivivax sp.]